MFRSIRTRLVAIHLLLILFALQLIGAYFVQALNQSLIRSATNTVTRQAQLIATIAEPLVAGTTQRDSSGSGNQGGSSILQSFPELLNGVVYVLNKDGVVKDTSAGTALIGQKRMDSTVTQTLVNHQRSVSIHYDPISNEHLLTVVVPVIENHTFEGMVESVVSIQDTYATMRQVTEIFYSGSAIVLLLTAILGVVLSRTIARPVRDVTQQARKLAAGDYSQRVQIQGNDEFGDLGKAINDLTDKVEQAIASNLHEQERLQAIIRYIGDGVLTFDRSFSPLFSNEAATRLISRAEVTLNKIASVLKSRQPKMEGKGDWNTILPFNETLIEMHVTPIRRQQRVDGYVALLRDVTEQEKLQSARRDFVANVSHELKTPLTSLKSYVEALQSYQDADEETRQRFLFVMENEVNRMVRLTQDLLQLSGLERKTEPYRASIVDVVDWLRSAVERFELPAEDQGIALRLADLYVGSCMVHGDRDMLDRLLDNLLGNALKYTPRGGRVDILAELGGSWVLIRIQDNGIGIPPDDLPHVFERFYTVDKSRTRAHGGTGLGLAIAREIVERHDGTITIQSESEVGTEVTIRLPIVGD